jgi:hypothetical protein
MRRSGHGQAAGTGTAVAGPLDAGVRALRVGGARLSGAGPGGAADEVGRAGAACGSAGRWGAAVIAAAARAGGAVGVAATADLTSFARRAGARDGVANRGPCAGRVDGGTIGVGRAGVHDREAGAAAHLLARDDAGGAHRAIRRAPTGPATRPRAVVRRARVGRAAGLATSSAAAIGEARLRATAVPETTSQGREGDGGEDERSAHDREGSKSRTRRRGCVALDVCQGAPTAPLRNLMNGLSPDPDERTRA